MQSTSERLFPIRRYRVKGSVKKMKNTQIVWKEQKKLRTGYTTGSCAAAAAKAAAEMLLSGQEVSQVSLLTPKQVLLYLDVECVEKGADFVSCAIQKDSGDDPDVTNGIYVHAKVQKTDRPGIYLDGGEGVGRVTRRGLEQPVGAAAINRVPRQMILEAVAEQKEQYAYTGGLSILIFIPEGRALAEKTFNPRLGIQGGISVLGTSGIVEPMSEQALIDTIFLEMKMRKEEGFSYCYVVPGNYGSDFLRETFEADDRRSVKCSNYIGAAIDAAVNLEMKGLLFVGHIGKLVKVAAGVMNTHSRYADCRMEILSAHAAMAGADRRTVRKLMKCAATTEALELLKQEGLFGSVMKTITERIEFHLQHRAGKDMTTEAIIFSKEEGILGETSGAVQMAEQIRRQSSMGSYTEERISEEAAHLLS